MKFKVFYSQEKDIQNYLNAGWRFKYRKFGHDPRRFLSKFPQHFQDELLKAKTKTEAVKVIKGFWKKVKSPNFNENTKQIIKKAEKLLSNKKNNIIKSLEDLYNKPFPFSQINVYLTTFPINPYNYKERWFMANRKANPLQLINTTKHELNHFMFYYYYSPLKQKLGEEKFEKLKEALAIFTNPEGNDKPEVKELEQYLKTLSGKSMDEIIEKAINSKYI